MRGGSCEALALSLSGGNQQKVVIAREISEQPKVLIAAQPTRGLDVGAIEFVHSRLIEQRDAGRAVLLVSLELEEIRSLSDRVLVMYDGRIVAELAPGGVRGGVRGRDARRPAGGRVSEGEGEGTHTVASQLSGYLRAGGIVTPLADGADRVLHRRPRGRRRRGRTRSPSTRRSSRARASTGCCRGSRPRTARWRR